MLLSDGIRESSSVGCDQLNDLLSLEVELGDAGERLRSIRDSHQQDLRNGGEWKGALFGVAGESTPNLSHNSRCSYTVGMRPWNPRPKEMRIQEIRMRMEVLLSCWYCLSQGSLSCMMTFSTKQNTHIRSTASTGRASVGDNKAFSI